MDSITWLARTGPEKKKSVIVSEYVLNDVGIFVKREKRVSKKAVFTALTGFRVGYHLIPGTDYRAVALDRNAILWHKITSLNYDGDSMIRVTGNQQDEIQICLIAEIRDTALRLIDDMRHKHPVVVEPDTQAAIWLCWRDDDDWGDPYRPLSDMIADEALEERYIDPDVLEETRLTVTPDPAVPLLGP